MLHPYCRTGDISFACVLSICMHILKLIPYIYLISSVPITADRPTKLNQCFPKKRNTGIKGLTWEKRVCVRVIQSTSLKLPSYRITRCAKHTLTHFTSLLVAARNVSWQRCYSHRNIQRNNNIVQCQYLTHNMLFQIMWNIHKQASTKVLELQYLWVFLEFPDIKIVQFCHKYRTYSS